MEDGEVGVADEQTEKGIGEPSADLADKLKKKRKSSDVENTQPNIVTPQEAPREGKKLKHGESKGWLCGSFLSYLILSANIDFFLKR